MRKILRIAAVAPALLALSGAAAATAAAVPAAKPSWHAVYRGPTTPVSTLSSIAVLSRTDAWAAGYHMFQDPNPSVLRWNGSKWLPVAVPGLASTTYAQVSASSAGNVWVLGGDINGTSVLQRWDGSAWSPITMPDQSISDVLTFGAADTWAADGGTCIGSHKHCTTKLVHWNGSTWKSYQVPVLVTDLSGSASGNIWVAGIYGGDNSPPVQPGKPVTFHWNGKAWLAAQSMPGPASYVLATVATSSPSDVWVTAPNTSQFVKHTGYVLHWNGKAWSKITVPAAYSAMYPAGPFPALLPDGHGGLYYGGVAHWTGGKWVTITPGKSFVGSAVPAFTALAQVPGSASIWAVGQTTPSTTSQTSRDLIAAYGPIP